MKPKILILGAGGAAGIGMTRCLKDFDVYGKDDWKWSRKLIEAKQSNIGETEFDLVIPVPDCLVKSWSFMPKTILPHLDEVELCQDKVKCAEVLGDLAPQTYWVRATSGAGGAGSKMASEYLPGRNISCELLYKDGKLYGYFMKHRLSYLVKRVEPSVFEGMGQSAVSVCINDKKILRLAKKAIKKISKCPNGVYGIDFREDEKGRPKITEINAGRFLTASYVYFYSTGYNLPKRMVELALGLPLTPLGKYPEGIGIIRQIDKLPYVGKV